VKRLEGPWRHWHQGPEGTATPSAGPDTAPAFSFRTSSRGMKACAGIAVARPETTSLSMSCGTRTQDFRPGDPDGARLLRSSLGDQLLAKRGDCVLLILLYCVLLVIRTALWPVTAPLSGSQPRRPSCVCSGLEPHRRTSRCARPQPTPSPRYCSLTSLLGTANCTYGYCHRVDCGLAHGGP
jgi:hypothetical protein